MLAYDNKLSGFDTQGENRKPNQTKSNTALTFSESVAQVEAPLSSSRRTASTSAALMAKNSTGMGTPDALGSAPRRNSSRIVDSIRS